MKFPTARATDAQLGLTFEGTLTARYWQWRQTEHGRALFLEVERLALEDHAAGERRIEINLLWAIARRTLRVSANNSYRAPAARELVRLHPHLAPLIERRRRTAD